MKCDTTDGKCECKSEYSNSNETEHKCDRCADSHYRANGICQNCNCHVTGSMMTTDSVAICGEFTGQCDCQPGYTGQTCNECLLEDGYIDTSTDNSGPVCGTFSDISFNEIDTSDPGADCTLTGSTSTITITTQIVGADGSGIPGMKIKYTCPGTNDLVIKPEVSDANGYIQFEATTKTGIALVAFDPNGVYADMILQPTIPTTTKRRVFFSSMLRGHDDEVLELTFSLSCASTRYGTNCASECTNCLVDSNGVKTLKEGVDNCAASDDGNSYTCNCKPGYFDESAQCDGTCTSCSKENVASCTAADSCTCLVGYYGDNCDNNCLSDCNPIGITSCDGSTCTCQAGYAEAFGVGCGGCGDGFYLSGVQCLECGCNTNGTDDVTCDSQGMCNCKSDITDGEKCDMCVAGKYPFPDCDQDCTDCVAANIISCMGNDDGADTCNCKPGYYGSDCSSDCLSNCNITNIDSCGIQVDDCGKPIDDIVDCNCKQGYYDDRCDSECTDCYTANIVSCTNTDPDDTNSEDVCNCKTGFYGEHCYQDCSDYCHVDGITQCSKENPTDFTPQCECKTGYYGTKCDQQCTDCNIEGLRDCDDATTCHCHTDQFADANCNTCIEGATKLFGVCYKFDDVNDFGDLVISTDDCGNYDFSNTDNTNLKIVVNDEMSPNSDNLMKNAEFLFTFTCPKCYIESNCTSDYCQPILVQKTLTTNDMGEVSIGHFMSGEEIVLYAHRTSGNYKDIVKTITPTKNETENIYVVEFDMECLVNKFGDNCEGGGFLRKL